MTRINTNVSSLLSQKTHRGKIPLDLGSGLLAEGVENDIDEAGEPLWDVPQTLEFAR